LINSSAGLIKATSGFDGGWFGGGSAGYSSLSSFADERIAKRVKLALIAPWWTARKLSP
jgi:hypothetical protein